MLDQIDNRRWPCRKSAAGIFFAFYVPDSRFLLHFVHKSPEAFDNKNLHGINLFYGDPGLPRGEFNILQGNNFWVNRQMLHLTF